MKHFVFLAVLLIVLAATISAQEIYEATDSPYDYETDLEDDYETDSEEETYTLNTFQFQGQCYVQDKKLRVAIDSELNVCRRTCKTPQCHSTCEQEYFAKEFQNRYTLYSCLCKFNKAYCPETCDSILAYNTNKNEHSQKVCQSHCRSDSSCRNRCKREYEQKQAQLESEVRDCKSKRGVSY